MLARLDNLPQRNCSETLYAAVPDVDSRASIRRAKSPGYRDPCSRNFSSHACQAKPPAIGLSLAEIAGIKSRQRPARAGPRDWHNASGNCGNPRHGPTARYRKRIEGGAERSERSETHFSGPYSGTQVFLGWPLGRMARPSSSTTARRQFGGPTGVGGCGSMAFAYSGRPSRRPASNARFGSAVSRPWRSAARPALSASPAWHPPRPARFSSAQGTAWPAPGSAPRPCRRRRRAWRTSAPMD
jgi:hypothetical protein